MRSHAFSSSINPRVRAAIRINFGEPVLPLSTPSDSKTYFIAFHDNSKVRQKVLTQPLKTILF